jgi:large subunit ribosomal protein L3
MKGLLGKKIGMTQLFNADGSVYPVTVIQSNACIVLQKKDKQNDDYEAIQLGFDDTKKQRMIKPEIGHAKKAGTTPKRFIREIRNVDISEYQVGQELSVNLFSEGEYVDISAVSKGKGFQGVIKRHNQSVGPMAHGSRYHRGPGSMGSIQANRVPKGKKLPGHMGNSRVTLQNLLIVKVDSELNVILVKGSIPGPKNSYVTISSALKK